MTDKSHQARSFAARRSWLPSFPLWAPPLLLVAAGILGLIISIPSGSVEMPYLILFAIAAIVGIFLVVPQGLVVTVAQIPLLFTLITPIVAWFTASFADPGKGGASDSTPPKTRLITAAYPIIQHFPFLAIITAVCAIIAIWRYVELRRSNAKVESTTRTQARARQKRDQEEVLSTSRAHDRIASSERRRASNRRRATAKAPGTERVAASDLIRRAGETRPKEPPAKPEPRRRIDADRTDSRPRANPRPQRPADRSRGASRPTPRPADRLIVSPSEQRRETPTQRREIPAQRLWGEGQQSRRDITEWPPRQERPRRTARGAQPSRERNNDRREWGERPRRDERGR